MGDKTKIEWSDATWNPVTGCTKVSPGCDHCYAETFAERWRGTPGHYYEGGFDVQLRPDKLDVPLRWRKPRMVFVNSMSDLFHAEIPDEYIARVFAVMAAARQHTFQLLTKRHARMRSLMVSSDFQNLMVKAWFDIPKRMRPGSLIEWPLPNLWLGVSVENQQWADIRIPVLMQTPAEVRFLSCEPLLGPVRLNRSHGHCPTHDFPGGFCGSTAGGGRCPDMLVPDWIIAGGESGPGARPMHPAWARGLRDDCQKAGIPFHFKQWGSWAPTGFVGMGHLVDERERLVGDPAADGHRVVMRRGDKRVHGRVLDGRTWDEFPVRRSEEVV